MRHKKIPYSDIPLGAKIKNTCSEKSPNYIGEITCIDNAAILANLSEPTFKKLFIMRELPPIRKVKTEERAKRMIEIADSIIITAEYTYNGRWYIVEFDCTDYQFMFLHKRLQKEFKPKYYYET